MKADAHNHFSRSLNKLLKRYKLSQSELAKIERIEASKIVSLAYTDDGGFDFNDGSYYKEDRNVNYKLKIDYLSNESDQAKTLILLPVMAEE